MLSSTLQKEVQKYSKSEILPVPCYWLLNIVNRFEIILCCLQHFPDQSLKGLLKAETLENLTIHSLIVMVK